MKRKIERKASAHSPFGPAICGTYWMLLMLSKTDSLLCQSSGIPIGFLVQSMSVNILLDFWPLVLHLAGMNPKHCSWQVL